MTSYPEHEKLAKIGDQSQDIGTFLDWLYGQEIHLAIRHAHIDACTDPDHEFGWHDTECGYGTNELAPVSISIEDLLARYFEIDLKVIDQEKRQMLDEHRRATGQIE